MDDCKYDHQTLLMAKNPADADSPFFWHFAKGISEHGALPGRWPDGTPRDDGLRAVVWCSFCGALWDGAWMHCRLQASAWSGAAEATVVQGV